MAVWTPGSYLVREYERHVERSPPGRPTAPRWPSEVAEEPLARRDRGARRASTVTYRVYGREMSVRTNWIERGFALLNGAPTFLTLAERGVTRPHVVALSLPAALEDQRDRPAAGRRRAAPLPRRRLRRRWSTRRSSPATRPSIEFEVDGKPHSSSTRAKAGVFDGAARRPKDVETIVARGPAASGASLPYEQVRLPQRAHRDRRRPRAQELDGADGQPLGDAHAPRATSNWLDLASHEYFHAWNVKRLRPGRARAVRLREREPHHAACGSPRASPAYYERRAGAARRADRRDAELTRRRSRRTSSELQTTPGRLVAAGGDGVVRRLDQVLPAGREHAQHRDQLLHQGRRWWPSCSTRKIRKATNGAKSLDDVMRLAYSRYAGAKGFTQADFKGVVHEVAGRDLGGVVDVGARDDRGAGLRRGARVVRPALQAGRSGARRRVPARRGSARRRRTTAAAWW